MGKTQMKTSLFVCALLSLASAFSSSDDVMKYILESEGLWAAACETGNTTTTERILTEDFYGTAERPPLGVYRYGKAESMKETSVSCRSNHFNGATIKFIGAANDSAVVWGNESWVDLNGTKGMYVWTDVWVLRDGSWMILTASDFTHGGWGSEKLPRIPSVGS
jgi:hypothetical protein